MTLFNQNSDLADLITLHDDCVTEFGKHYKSGKKNGNYLRGIHNDEDEKNRIRKQHRQPYNISLTATKLNRLLSEQRSNRLDWKPRGREEADEITAEMGGYLMRYIEDTNDFKYVESEIYQSGLAKKYGVLGARIDTTKDVRGELVLEHIPFNEVCWDVNNKKYDLAEGVEFFDRFYFITKRRLLAEYPKLKEKIEGLSPDNFTDNNPLKEPKQWFRTDKKKDLVKVVDHWEKINKKVIILKNIISGQDPAEFETMKQVDEFIQQEILKSQAQAVLSQMNAQMGGQMGTPQPPLTKDSFKTLPATREYWKLTKYCCFDILEEREQDYLPYSVYFCYFDPDEGVFWCMTDLASDSQLMYDRYLSLIDKSISKNIRGNNYVMYPNLLHPKETNNLDSLKNDLVDGGRMVLGVDPNRKIITQIGSQTNIQVESSLVAASKELIEEIFGGRTFQGLGSSKRQTATESTILENQARQATFLFLDNLIRWKTQVGRLVWRMMGEVYTEDRQIRITGDTLSQELKQSAIEKKIYKPSMIEPDAYGFINLSSIPKPIQNTNVDIVIDNVEATSTVRQQKFLMLTMLNKLMVEAYGQPIPLEILLPYADIDYTDKQKLIAWETKQQEAKAKAMEEQKQRANVDAMTNILHKTKGEQKSPERAVVSGQ